MRSKQQRAKTAMLWNFQEALSRRSRETARPTAEKQLAARSRIFGGWGEQSTVARRVKRDKIEWRKPF